MGFNQTYSAIERLWKNKFENQVPKKEVDYLKNLKTSFQNKNYIKALNITNELFSYFVRIGDDRNHSLSSDALKIADLLWALGENLEKKVKQPSGAVVYVD